MDFGPFLVRFGPKVIPFWAQFWFHFGPLLVLKMIPLRGAIFERKHKDFKGFLAFLPPKGAPFWDHFGGQSLLHFGSFLSHFGPFVGALLGQPEPPILPSLWAGPAGPWGRG